MEFEGVLRTFADFFERNSIAYVIIGGVAVNAWGRARSTKDVDFAVDAGDKDRVLAFTESLGYQALHVSEAFSNHAHSDPACGRVDFMYLKGKTAEQVFSAASSKPLLPGRDLAVASPEHLAMMKALSMKNFPHRALYEGEDVRVLLAVPGVDRAVVRDYFERHGLLELYDAIEKAL